MDHRRLLCVVQGKAACDRVLATLQRARPHYQYEVVCLDNSPPNRNAPYLAHEIHVLSARRINLQAWRLFQAFVEGALALEETLTRQPHFVSWEIRDKREQHKRTYDLRMQTFATETGARLVYERMLPLIPDSEFVYQNIRMGVLEYESAQQTPKNSEEK